MKEKKYTYKEFIDKFFPNRKCPKCGMDILKEEQRQNMRFEVCNSCGYEKYIGTQIVW